MSETRYGNFSDEDIKQTAKLGSIWLDKNHPNWESLINLQELEMASCTDCIIGQAIGNYDKVLGDLGYDDIWAVENGFCAPCHYDEDDSFDDQATDEHYTKLERAWRDEVMNRRD